MDQDGSKHKKTVLVVLLLLIVFVFVILGALLFSPKDTTKPQSSTTDITYDGFSPFDRQVAVRNIETGPQEDPYVYTPPPEIVEPVRVNERTYTIIDETPEEEYFIEPTPEIAVAFNIPKKQTQTSQISYSPDYAVGYTDPKTYFPYYQPKYQGAPTLQGPVAEDPVAPPEDDDFREGEKQLFGILTGLGWIQLLGGDGEDLFEDLYAYSPSGIIYDLFNKDSGGGGGIAGGGIGGLGGGGGTSQQFGGRVTSTTQCTCSDSVLIDIQDVRGQTLSLLYVYGVSETYSYYNVQGTGQNVLGTYTSGGSCLVVSGTSCSTEGNPSGTIQKIGTSE